MFPVWELGNIGETRVRHECFWKIDFSFCSRFIETDRAEFIPR